MDPTLITDGSAVGHGRNNYFISLSFDVSALIQECKEVCRCGVIFCAIVARGQLWLGTPLRSQEGIFLLPSEGLLAFIGPLRSLCRRAHSHQSGLLSSGVKYESKTPKPKAAS